MEDRQGKRSSKAAIIKGLNATVRPIKIQMDNHLVIGGTGHYHQETNSKIPTILDRYAEKHERSTPIVSYFRSRSPVVGKLPSVGDTFSTPVADVINANYRSSIINHFASSTSGSSSFGSRRGGSSLSPLSAIENLETTPVRSPQIYGTPLKVHEEVIVMDEILISSVHGGAKTLKSALDSGSGGGSSLSKNQYRTDICRSWEDSGSCRFGHKCQFAHGKEELRPVHLPLKTKPKE
ncbi:mRNA decay activator protein ZFP36L2-like isoform X2 [Cucurbita pepo subsp. pepo]|uniref:mRNA decay activator protein ZFP36L2-like isoform X2 n=1 Tax=Cucurbita pepo subsp. pepo TaxID=3664 RepID=UPI000C9D2D9B|nr:mRNA decay activator protein ZFP36L2-like isoform X2 [Cucurbita pepo subsp. pepo]